MDGRDRLPPLNQLRVFEAAARLGSFTQAGRELHLTQSAVSQQIKSLEHALGRPLFVRRTRSVAPTEAGRAYLPIVQRVLDELVAGTDTVFGRRDETRVSVQVTLSFAVHWLTPRLPDFIERHPDVGIDLVTVVHEPERDAPAADIEIRFEDDAPGAELLFRNRCFPVCSPEHAADADWRVDRLYDTSTMRVGWSTWLAEQGAALPSNQRVHLARTYAVGLQAAERPRALAMALDTFADRLIAEGRLARPFEHTTAIPERYWLLAPKPGQRSDAARAFRDWLLQAAHGERNLSFGV